MNIPSPDQQEARISRIKSNTERQTPKNIKEIEPSHLARYKFALNKIKRGKILDVSCGAGYGSYLLRKKASQIIGLDKDTETINNAKKYFHSKNIQFIKDNAETMKKLKKEKFDYIISFETIEHLDKPKKLLETCEKLLNKKGLLIISTPRKPHGNPYHKTEFTLNEYKKILSKYFNIKETYGQVYDKIFKLNLNKINPKSYKRFNFICICSKK